MTIQVGDKLPSVNLFFKDEEGVQKIGSDELFGSGKTLLAETLARDLNERLSDEVSAEALVKRHSTMPRIIMSEEMDHSERPARCRRQTGPPIRLGAGRCPRSGRPGAPSRRATASDGTDQPTWRIG